jgi:UDP-GlcNAc:undecaprenyl-phosphate GlcNAc-1-phosphate transferase
MKSLIALLGPGLLAAGATYLSTPVSSRIALWAGAIDRPGPRKVHRTPIPRLGGLAVLLGILAGFAAVRGVGAALPGMLLGLGLGLMPILVASVWDDIRPIRALSKLLAQAVAAAIAVWSGIGLLPDVHLFGTVFHIGWLAIPISLVWITGVTNAFNIVDGLDGLSAGLALISAGGLAAVFLFSQQTPLAGAAIVVAGAVVGFLPWNLFPAKVFLGETGAASIGFVLACLSLQGGLKLSAGFATVLPICVLGLPVAETLVSIARRVLRRLEMKEGGGVMEADRNHIHHRLLALGIGHRQAVLILYGVGLVFAMGGLASVLMSTRKAGLLLITLLAAGFIGLARLGYDEFALIRRGSMLQVYEAPVLKRSFFVVFLDIVMMAVAVYVAAGLRTSDWELESQLAAVLRLFALVAPLSVASFSALGLYKGAWRLASLDDFVRATGAVVTGSLAALAGAQLFAPAPDLVPLVVIYTLLMLAFVNGSRVSYRVLQHRQWRASRAGRPALIYGAGLGGASVLRELLSNPAAGMRPVGFLDDDPEKLGRVFGGFPVLGSLEDLESVLEAEPGAAVVVSSAKISAERCAILSEACRVLGAPVLRYQVSFEPILGVLGPEDESVREVTRAKRGVGDVRG